jgi:hypothetical protein
MTNPDEKSDGLMQNSAEASNQSEQLNRFDWDFTALYEADVSEITACCFYEYARESSSILAHYNEDKEIESLPGGLHYPVRIDGLLRTFPNPLYWPWSRSLLGKLFVKPWQEMDTSWRTFVCGHYKGNTAGLPAWLKRDNPIRGEDMPMLDSITGRQRLVVEIDWASYTNAEIVESFESWLKDARPKDIGLSSLKGRNKDTSWTRKLENLAIMRLLHCSTLSNLKTEFPDAVERLNALKAAFEAHGADGGDRRDSREREVYRKREYCLNDFHELFPFLPDTEEPISWPFSRA